jgi:adenylate cyclase
MAGEPDDKTQERRRQDEPEGKPPRKVRERAKKVDSAPSLLAAIDMLRERLPGDPQFGDPLSTAGKRPVEVVAREASSLQPSRPSAAHSLGLAALQVWQAFSERQGRGAGDEPISVLFTDLVGFSSWALEAGDAAAIRLLREAGSVLEGSVDDHGGAIVKRLGDGLMAVFDQPAPAIESALEAHDGLAKIDVDGYTPQMRAGVHHGRPRKLGGDYLGVDVNIAARVADSAKGGQVLVSEPVCELLEEGTFELGRARRLRAEGAPKDLRVCEIKRIASPSA